MKNIEGISFAEDDHRNNLLIGDENNELKLIELLTSRVLNNLKLIIIK